jgi:hypothetical protein
MKRLLLVLLVVSLLLVACEPNQPKLPPRHEPVPGNSAPPKYVPPVKENVTVPVVNDTASELIPEPDVILEPVINDTASEPIPEPDVIPEPAFVYSKDTFFTDILVDLESFNPSVEEIKEVMEIASFKFKQLTGYNLELRDVHYLKEITGTGEMSGTYKNTIQYDYFLTNNQGLNGAVILTKEFNTESNGGFSSLYRYDNYCNPFKSIIREDNDWLYFSYQDWNHKYSTCGYDFETKQHISSISLSGECRNQLGTQCVFNGDYYICDYAQEDYYAEENVFVACTIVHEFMHPFGENGNYDHYGTQTCNEAMGITYENNTIEESQYYCGMCPNTYGNFKESFVDC